MAIIPSEADCSRITGLMAEFVQTLDFKTPTVGQVVAKFACAEPSQGLATWRVAGKPEVMHLIVASNQSDDT